MRGTAVGVEPGDEEIRIKVKTILQRMREVVEKVYPYPVPWLFIEVPFNERGALAVLFVRSVRVPTTFFPNYVNSAIVSLNRSRRIKAVSIVFEGGRIRSVHFIDSDGKDVFSDPGGDAGLAHMLIPEVFEAVKRARIESTTAQAEKWFREFVETAEFVSRLDEVKHVDPLDLLNRAGRVEQLDVYVARPMKNLDEIHMRIDAEKRVLTVDLSFYPYGRGFVECSFSGSDLDDIKISASVNTTEKRVRRYLMNLPDSILDDIRDSVRRFLEGYKLFRVAISFMKL